MASGKGSKNKILFLCIAGALFSLTACGISVSKEPAATTPSASATHDARVTVALAASETPGVLAEKDITPETTPAASSDRTPTVIPSAGITPSADITAFPTLTSAALPSDETGAFASPSIEINGVHELRIYTEDAAPIDSKTEYINAKILADGTEYDTKIRGRGNSSWHQLPKKAYRLKLSEKAAVFGMPSDRDWVLVSNYVDPTLIRNAVTYDMAQVMSCLTWNPSFVFVDLYLNDEYLGLYEIFEKIEEGKQKLPLGETVRDEKGKIIDMGFVLEWGWDYDCENVFGLDYFMTNSGDSIYIKDPKVEYQYDEVMTYTRRYIKALENAVETGGDYEKYIDVDNWVDWFIINELTNNTECSFYRSLYMYKKAGGKLCLGPLWDYDTAFGNFLEDITDYNGWVATDSTYIYFQNKDIIAYILEDEAFQEKVKKRWAEVKEILLSTALSSIDLRSEEIAEARLRDEERWPKVLSGSRIGMARSTTYGFTDYESHIEYMRSFLLSRYEWMDEHLTREGNILDNIADNTPDNSPDN